MPRTEPAYTPADDLDLAVLSDAVAGEGESGDGVMDEEDEDGAGYVDAGQEGNEYDSEEDYGLHEICQPKPFNHR